VNTERLVNGQPCKSASIVALVTEAATQVDHSDHSGLPPPEPLTHRVSYQLQNTRDGWRFSSYVRYL